MTPIFVFGSNLAGRHGAGSARHAWLHYGAIWGRGSGRQGNSYAIPTKDEKLDVLPLETIAKFVSTFIAYARNNPHLTFDIVAIGCGLAGYKPAQIAPMFKDVPDNCIRPAEFRKYV